MAVLEDSLLCLQGIQVLLASQSVYKSHGAEAMNDLEAKIAQGAVVEHPAREDLIAVEDLDTRLQDLDAYLRDLRGLAGSCAQ